MRFLHTIILISVLLASCQNNSSKSQHQVVVSDAFLSKAVIYEVNVRQYTEEGTFNAFATHLPKLKELGVDILWFMPIHPIGKLNRKGELGSYYSISDYR